ncbi:hypothetical protein AM501_05385 [Aneurinibacillus migulanus]|uniref:hypothetical protein n=1 Tax=Aneurinibacillus migulanus TaxID=47500 RepID=UPI0005BB14B6|nr:hypothetical protein [Aneurinibacillus migulanus]KIV58560.1 hypothetical protein TS64_04230 [Aneurinibacillus migulanus]KPD09268.1 hypothetical protein AM501_05385 [Aneurinibacillus migulanus]CEH28308.1 DNA polymerase III subunit beta [Aneurinibacillus migulanus]
MFKIQAEQLQEIVGAMAKSARKAKLGERFIFIKTYKNEVSFFYNGDDISVEKRVQTKIQAEMDVATTVKEMDVKVSALPSDEEITLEMQKNQILLRWGRKSKISVETVAETSPLLEIPETARKVKWVPGSLHGLTRIMTPYAALRSSQRGLERPSICGPSFEKEPITGDVIVRATDSFRAITVKAEKIDWFEHAHLTLDSDSLHAICDVISDDAEVEIGINDKNSLIVFRCGNTTAVARTLVGNFPPLDKNYLTMDKAVAKWYFDRQDLIDLCRRIRKLSPTKHKLTLRIQEGKPYAVIPSVLEQQLGIAIDGTPFDFAVNATYLEMIAATFRSEEVVLLLTEGLAPITIISEDSSDIRTLVLPMKIDE